MRNNSERSRKRPRWVLTLAAAAAVTVALAGCTSGGGGSSASGGGSGSNDLLQEIIKRGTVNVGECLGNPPYGFYTSSNKPEGYDIDIANLIGKDLGVKTKIVNVAPAARIPSLQTGKIDVVLCNTTRTLQRAEKVSFTNTYSVSASSILSNKGSGIATLKDLAGKTVATTKGTPFQAVIQAAEPTAKVIQFDNPADDVTAVKTGQADAAIEDGGFLLYAAKKDPSLQVASGSITPLYYNSFAIEQDQPNLLAWLNEFIFELNTDGQNQTIYKKWFGINPRYQLNPAY